MGKLLLFPSDTLSLQSNFAEIKHKTFRVCNIPELKRFGSPEYMAVN